MGVDASALNKLARRFALASRSAPKELESAARAGQPLAKREMKRAIGARYNLTPARLESGVRVSEAGRYGMQISGSDRPIMVNRGYRATQNKQGLRYAIEKGSPVVLSNGFISKKKKFALKRLGKSRLPIEPVTGPGVGTILGNSQVTDAPVQIVIDVMAERVTSKLSAVIDG